MKKAILKIITFYKKFISPMLPDACRFSPTCSEYAFEAVSKHGVFKGAFLSVYRILRCNPFCKGGFDPVPDNVVAQSARQ
ncbi:MAG: membrane protein insertion efficiency factor YidD [Defluviitaleaceae bacterium]|nr:membrane protein insertion efficiency factor YidD [Defluviitaleaceae bacterium]